MGRKAIQRPAVVKKVVSKVETGRSYLLRLLDVCPGTGMYGTNAWWFGSLEDALAHAQACRAQGHTVRLQEQIRYDVLRERQRVTRPEVEWRTLEV